MEFILTILFLTLIAVLISDKLEKILDAVNRGRHDDKPKKQDDTEGDWFDNVRV